MGFTALEGLGCSGSSGPGSASMQARLTSLQSWSAWQELQHNSSWRVPPLGRLPPEQRGGVRVPVVVVAGAALVPGQAAVLAAAVHLRGLVRRCGALRGTDQGDQTVDHGGRVGAVERAAGRGGGGPLPQVCSPSHFTYHTCDNVHLYSRQCPLPRSRSREGRCRQPLLPSCSAAPPPLPPGPQPGRPGRGI